MKRKLEMDDVRIGMYITVLNGKMEQRVFPGPDGPVVKYKEKDHYNGKILEVIALDMPYIIVTCHEPRGSRNDTLDLRHVEIMHLTGRYIHSLLPDLELTKDSFWNECDIESVDNANDIIDEMFKGL